MEFATLGGHSQECCEKACSNEIGDLEGCIAWVATQKLRRLCGLGNHPEGTAARRPTAKKFATL
jgi:hypothetical protein